VKFRTKTLTQLAGECGLALVPLDWRHPRQVWAAFVKPGFDRGLINDGRVHWNHLLGPKCAA
jgi:hypothetical protein